MKRSAFTLIELIAVMGLIVLLSTMTIGAYFGISRAMAKNSSTQRLAAYLQLARQRASTDSEPVHFITIGSTNFMIVRPAGVVTKTKGLTSAFQDHYDRIGAATTNYADLVLYNLTAIIDNGQSPSDTGNRGTVQEATIEEPNEQIPFSPLQIKYKNFKVAVGDKYGVSAYPEVSLPKGFEFERESQNVVITFNPDGTVTFPSSVNHLKILDATKASVAENSEDAIVAGIIITAAGKITLHH